MACKFIYNNIEYSSKEEFINKLVIPNFINQPKTLRVQEQQSDFFQKIRNNFTIKGNNYTKSKDKDNNPTYFLNGKSISKSEHEKGWNEYLDTSENSEDTFLKLLLRNDNWITFFIKATIQSAAKKGYKKVLFPKGETAAKIEGHESITEEITRLNDQIEDIRNSGLSTSEQENYIQDIEKRKQELKSQGIEKLKPVEAFYEIKVGNILDKQFGKDNVKTITDEYGNQWREIDLSKVIKVEEDIPTEQETLDELEELGRKLKKECFGKEGTIRAEEGFATGSKGGMWSIVKDLKGLPTHAQGGVNLSINDGKVHFVKGKNLIHAKHGMYLVKKEKQPIFTLGTKWEISSHKCGGYAEHGAIIPRKVKQTEPINSVRWAIVKDLKGPSHKNGGIDLKIEEGKVTFSKGKSRVHAKCGCLIRAKKAEQGVVVETKKKRSTKLLNKE